MFECLGRSEVNSGTIDVTRKMCCDVEAEAQGTSDFRLKVIRELVSSVLQNSLVNTIYFETRENVLYSEVPLIPSLSCSRRS